MSTILSQLNRLDIKIDLNLNGSPAVRGRPLDQYELWTKVNKFFYSKGDESNGFRKVRWQPTDKQWEWFNWVLAQEKPFAFMGARKIGKTELLTIFQSVYLIYRDPNSKIIILTGNKSRATKIISAIKLILDYLGFKYRSSSSSEFFVRQNTTKTPTLQSKGLNAKLKGDHLDLIIIDDPLDDSERNSKAKKEKVESVYNECLSMVENKRLMLIGQYVAVDDIFSTKKGKIPFLEQWYYGNEDLCKVDIDEMLLAGVSLGYINRNYLGKVEPDGSCPFKDLKPTISKIPRDHIILATLDVAYGGADSTALSIGGLDENQEHLIASVFKWPKHWLDVSEEIRAILTQYDTDIFFYEDKKNTHIKQVFGAWGFDSRPMENREHKVNRINRLATLHKAGLVKVHRSSDPKAIKQLRMWNEESKEDDVPDSLEMLSRKFFRGFEIRRNAVYE